MATQTLIETEVVRKFTVGDRLVSLYFQCLDGAGMPINITGQTLKFFMDDIPTGTSKIANATASIVTAASGHGRYDWAAADVDTEGEYWGWVVRTSGGLKAHQPGQGHYLRIVWVAAE